MKDLSEDLALRKQQHLYRRRRVSDGPQQIESVIDNQSVINFCSNDYLGFANHPKVKQAFIDGIKHYGSGSGSAHLINGHSRAHHQLEEELAEFCGYPRALLFSTGYMANLAIAQTLLGRSDNIFEDRLNHASLIDSGLLSGARFKRYAHNNSADLDKKLNATKPDTENLILTDSVFSMDGNVADISSLCSITNKHQAWLMIDDAHGFGTLGEQGKGTLERQNISTKDVPIYMATLGKAMGTSGAFIAGSDDLIETLIQKARTYIYTTASPPALAEATRCSLKLLQDEPKHKDRLQKNIEYFQTSCLQQSISLEASETAIQPIIIGEDAAALDASNKLLEKGFLITAIRPPTVPVGTARLRITLSATHTHEHIDKLVESLAQLSLTS